MKNKILIFLCLFIGLSAHGQEDTVSAVPSYYPEVSRYVPDHVRDSILSEMTNYFRPLIMDSALGKPEGYKKLDYNQIIKFKKVNRNDNWVIVQWVLVLLLFIVLRKFYFNKIVAYFTSLLSDNMFKEGLDTITRDFSSLNLILYTIKALVFSFIAYLFLSENTGLELEMEGLQLYLLLGLFLLAFLLLEKLFRLFFAYLLELKMFHKNILLIHNSIDTIAVVVLFPLSILYYYSFNRFNLNSDIGTIFLLVVTLYSVIKLILSVIKNRERLTIHSFLLISYLCAFEILPYLILIRVINI